MKEILSYSFEEYTQQVKSFHGAVAPGAVLGGYMIDLAYRNLPKDRLYDVICETGKCLPDAVQLLTPCSMGNQWMKVVDVGRFAMTFYDKETGDGVRVYLDFTLLDKWPAIKDWYLKLKPKAEQDKETILHEIRDAGSRVCGIEKIRVAPEHLAKKKGGSIAICPSCQEAYPSSAGAICLACKGGKLPYTSGNPGYIDRVPDII